VRAFAFFVAAALALTVAGCRGKDAPAPAASMSLPEPPAPASLVAELSVGNPKQTWLGLRQLGGDLAQALPSSLPVLLATSLSLPSAAAGNLDEGVPMVGAVLSRPDSSEPDVVLGMHVISGAELVASLTLGDAAKFRRVELGPRLQRLVSAPGAPELDGALGVSGNYLLLASRPEALRDAGRFVAESVSKRARTEPGLSLSTQQGVLGGVLARRLRELWQAQRGALGARAQAERQARGRPADFAEPEALLAGADGTIESWLGVLESSRALSLNVTPEPARLRVELALTPGESGAAAQLSKELVVGPMTPLLALPRQTNAALLWRSEAAPAATEPRAVADSLGKLFGARLTEAQTKKLSDAWSSFSRARHGASVVALVPTRAPSLLLTFELKDAEAFSKACPELLALLELPPVSGWLSGVWGKPSIKLLPKAADGAELARLRFQRAAGARPALPPSLSVRWLARDGVGRVLISADEATGFAELANLQSLGQAGFFSQPRLGLGDQTAFALLADLRLLVPVGSDDAPFLVTFGKQAERTTLALDLSPAALPALARAFALDRSP
jgi:hypothetical protein